MTVDPRTRQHLDTAARNQDIARELLNPALPISLQPRPFEWIVVLAFYAAVHYVNAYLWERQRYEPRDHGAREGAIARTHDLQSAYGSYMRLRDLSYRARYRSRYRISRADAEVALRSDLDQVERTVRAALGGP